MSGRGIDYFENSRRATLSQRAYAIANPGGWAGYNGNVWGLTACDGPANKTLTLAGRSRQFQTYSARGVALGDERDDGTICPPPWAARYRLRPSSDPRAARHAPTYGNHLFSTYGFLDAFNPTFTAAGQQESAAWTLSWLFDVDYLGIDQAIWLGPRCRLPAGRRR